MTESDLDYYTYEINKALEGHDTDYNLSIKIFGTKGESHTLDLTPECIEVLQIELTKIKLAYMAKKRGVK